MATLNFHAHMAHTHAFFVFWCGGERGGAGPIFLMGGYTGEYIYIYPRFTLGRVFIETPLQLTSLSLEAPTRVVSQEGDGVLTFAIDRLGLHACTSHRTMDVMNRRE